MELSREILPLVFEKEIAPPLPALPDSEVDSAFKREIFSEILPLVLEKEIAPPFPVLLGVTRI